MEMGNKQYGFSDLNKMRRTDGRVYDRCVIRWVPGGNEITTEYVVTYLYFPHIPSFFFLSHACQYTDT